MATWIYLISAFFVLPSNPVILAVYGVLGIGLNYFWIEVLLKIKK
jgi:hypothetical protein